MTIKELFGIKPAPTYFSVITTGEVKQLADRLEIPVLDLFDAIFDLNDEAEAGR